MNKVFVLVCQWLLISVLFVTPIAIAQHQVDHLEHAQTTEQCDLCNFTKTVESGHVSPSPLTVTILSKTELEPALDSDLVIYNSLSNFLTRAPPFSVSA